MSIISEYGSLLLLMTVIFSFFMAWGTGANDVANAMATSVGSKALTLKQAIYIAIIFEFTGAFLAGGEVTATIRKGIVDPELFSANPELLLFGMLASLLAAGTWLLIATLRGWPVSTTHSIVGAIVGFAAVGISIDAVHWGKVASIATSWIVSPVCSGCIAFTIYFSIRRLILNSQRPLYNAKRYLPMYLFLVGYMISMVTLVKGLKHVGLELTYMQSAQWALLGGMGIVVLGYARLKSHFYQVENLEAYPVMNTSGVTAQINLKFYNPPCEINTEYHRKKVNRVFSLLMMFTACAMAFAHGSNDVANAIGPLAAVVEIINNGGAVSGESSIPTWVLLLGAGGIVLGLVTYGHKVIATVGTNITVLTPASGFAATLAAATTVVIASGTGMPISTTHTLVGAILGIGIAHGLKSINLAMLRTIVTSWFMTIPAGACLCIVFFYIFKFIFKI